MKVFLAAAVAAAVVVATPAAEPVAAGAAPLLIPPVDGAISRRFSAPATRWGSGHRGIDYEVPAGTVVRAAAAGTVTFAGPVAGKPVVSVAHAGGLQTTYSHLSEVFVSSGERVDEGHWLGRVEAAHEGDAGGLHFGVKALGVYADPETFLGPVDVAGAIHLAPLVPWPPDGTPRFLAETFGAGSSEVRCAGVGEPPPAGVPPSENVAVVVAGISSGTAGGEVPRIGRDVPRALGYPPRRTYLFSYRGLEGPHLHAVYDPRDTYGDLRAAARLLSELLVEIGRHHPGRDVDLIAHSQGGLVARSFLEELSNAWDPRLPRVDHLVTFATPHSGAALARGIGRMRERTVTGRHVLKAARALAGGGLPDPAAPALAQLAPGSSFLRDLASEEVAFGTRVLALASPTDLVVTADRARYPGHTSRVVGPHWGWAHTAIVGSQEAQGLAYAFLRDAPLSCPGEWDTRGPAWGRRLGWLQSNADRVLSLGESLAGGVGRLLEYGLARRWRQPTRP